MAPAAYLPGRSMLSVKGFSNWEITFPRTEVADYVGLLRANACCTKSLLVCPPNGGEHVRYCFYATHSQMLPNPRIQGKQ